MNTSQRGYTIIEILAALGVGAMMLVGLSAVVDSSLQTSKSDQAALYQSQVVAATKKYLTDSNPVYQAVRSAATDVTPVNIGIAELITAQYLPANFSITNTYSQTTCIHILKPSALLNPPADSYNVLIVTQGGQNISNVEAATIAANAGVGGGYFETNALAHGAFGTWTLKDPELSLYTTTPCATGTTGPGHLASFLPFDNTSQLNPDFIYRDAVNGRPELNRMNTSLHLTGNAIISNANLNNTDVCNPADNKTWGKIALDENGILLNCENGKWKAGNTFWLDPVTTYNNLPATGQPGEVRMVTDISRAFAWNNLSNTWTPLFIDKDGNLTIPSSTTVANSIALGDTTSSPTLGGVCSASNSNLLISSLPSGEIVTCQSGQWQSQRNSDIDVPDKGCQTLVKSTQITGPCPDYTGSSVYYAYADFYETTIIRPVTLKGDGIIYVNAFNHINRGMYDNTGTSLGDQYAAFVLIVEIIDNDTSNTLAINWVSTPVIKNDSMGMSTILKTFAKKNVNGYSVKSRTRWTTYEGPSALTSYNRSNFYTTQLIETVPLETNWNISVYY